MHLIKQSEATAARRSITVNEIAGTAGITWTIKKVSKNGSSYAAMAGTVAEVGDGLYQVVLAAADVGTLGHLKIILSDEAGALAFAEATIVAFDPYDAVRLGLTAIPNATAGANGGLPLQGSAIPNANAGATGGLQAGIVRAATAQAGASSTITLDGSASATDDIYNGYRIRITSGTGAGQGNRLITDYVGSTKVATVGPDWTTAPDNTSVFEIYPC